MLFAALDGELEAVMATGPAIPQSAVRARLTLALVCERGRRHAQAPTHARETEPGSRPANWSGVGEEVPYGDAECVCEPPDRPHGWIARTALQVAQIASLHTCRKRQRLLRQPCFKTAGPHIASELGDQIHGAT